MNLLLRDLASFDEAGSQWLTEAGTYTFRIGANSRDIKATASLKLPEYTEKTSNALAPQQPPIPERGFMLVFNHIYLSAIVFGSKRPSCECLIPLHGQPDHHTLNDTFAFTLSKVISKISILSSMPLI